ncbi:MAG: Trk system potassium transporter TrkA [Clostridia bacterium]|nr:Trk system potassium transporter TrkA [Clostridia bacterium]
MKIIISGCGKIGATILESLVAEGHDIVAIDNNQSVIQEITNVYDVMGVCGNCFDCDVLEEAGISEAELFIAVAGSDESNMMSCFLARKLGAKHTIARIRNPEYNDKSLSILRHHFELSMSINPERLAAHEIFNILKFPSAVKIDSFSRRSFEMIEFRLKDDSVLDGLTLSGFRDKYKTQVLICCVLRDDEIFIPGGNFVLKSGDKISLAATHTDITKLFKELGLSQKQSKNVMILGGSRISYYLSEMLASAGISVKIIDRNEKNCELLSDLLPKAVIINADGSQQDLLLEEGLTTMDAFVSLTGMDEENILISIFAATQNVPKVISKVNKDELASMAEKLGLDTIVSPKKIVSDVIIRYARALRNSLGSSVETLYKVMDGHAEALEFIVKDDARIVNIPLKNLRLKKNILIGGITRDRKRIVPGGNDVILPGDHVIIIAANQRLQELADILEK